MQGAASRLLTLYPMLRPLNHYSRNVTNNPEQPAARAMLYGIGLTDADMDKAQIGIVSTGWEGNPCNMHLNALAAEVKEGVNAEHELLGTDLPHHRRQRRDQYGHRWDALQPTEPRCDCR